MSLMIGRVDNRICGQKQTQALGMCLDHAATAPAEIGMCRRPDQRSVTAFLPKPHSGRNTHSAV